MKFLVAVALVAAISVSGVLSQEEKREWKCSPVNPSITNECIGCICEAASGCNVDRKCSGGFCGPFVMSVNFWIEAGRCVKGNEDPNSALGEIRKSVAMSVAVFSPHVFNL